jgi:tetratricopeptide (TPR) repeat protein
MDHIASATKLIQEGKLYMAERLLLSVLEADASVHQLLGVIAFQTNRANEAIELFEKAALVLKDDAYLHNNLGQVHRSLGNFDSAKIAFEKAAILKIDYAEPLNFLGLLLLDEGNIIEAEEAFKEAISRHTKYPQAHFHLGVLYQEDNRLDEARKCYQNAIQIDPTYVQAINNLGTVFDELGQHVEAERTLLQGLDISPDMAELHCSFGSCLRLQSKYLEACDEFAEAIKIRPTFSQAIWNLGFLQLAMSDYSNGWFNYLYRHSVDREECPLPVERLDENLTGHDFLLIEEQGLGDIIFFLRFSSELIRRGAKLYFQPDIRIEPLIRRVGNIVIDGVDKPLLAIGDLPYLLNSTNAVPSINLEPTEGSVRAMERRLKAAGPGPYIGITYRAGGADKDSLFKKAPLDGIGRALKNISATFVNVQRSPEPKETLQLSRLMERPVADFSDVNNNLEEALALMNLLNDYVGVSNLFMHLRAATGRTAHVLVTHPGEYRWQVEGNSSPWFPDFLLYRQEPNGSWEKAFSSLTKTIKFRYN